MSARRDSGNLSSIEATRTGSVPPMNHMARPMPWSIALFAYDLASAGQGKAGSTYCSWTYFWVLK